MTNEELLSYMARGDFARGLRQRPIGVFLGSFATGQATLPAPVVAAFCLPD